jgi:hypothetical protein
MDSHDKIVLSEDPNAGFATPVMDLFAAGVLAIIAIWMMVEALRLPVPGGIVTAPGLLPFLTAASLLVMAIVLGAMAISRRSLFPDAEDRFQLPPDFLRSMSLGTILFVYVAALDFTTIDAAFTIGALRFVLGAFELVSVIVLTAILWIYWRKPLWVCLAVSLGWIAFLSIIFRMVFHTQLP